LRALLASYPDVFNDLPGRTDLLEHVITLRDDKPRINRRHYTVPESLKAVLEAELVKMLEWDFLEESDSEFISPLLVVRRPDKPLRVVHDLRSINEKTVPMGGRTADPQAILNKAAGSRYISLIDLKKCFFQIPLHKDSRRYCSFVTHIGQFQWKVMPPGTMNGSKTCQKLLDRVLRGLQQSASSFQDDIIVHSPSFAQHCKDIAEVLNRLRQAGLTANAPKCQFLLKRMTILGHIIEDGKIKPSDKKIAPILTIEKLNTKKQIKSLLGVVNFFRAYIPNCSEKVLPLTALLKKISLIR
jgi:hypothetical protein